MWPPRPPDDQLRESSSASSKRAWSSSTRPRQPSRWHSRTRCIWSHSPDRSKLPFCWTALSFPIQKPFEFISVGQQNDSAGPRVGHTGRRRAGWNGWHCASGRQPRIHRDQFRGGPAELCSDYADLRTAWSQRGRCIHLPGFKGCHQLASRSQKLIDSTPAFYRTQNLSAWRTDVRVLPCRSGMAMGEKLMSSRVPAHSTLIR